MCRNSPVVAQLERYLYVNNFGYERPRVKVGNMLDSVDAIRYYSQTLDDLNKLIATEQAVARRLATYSKPRAIIASSSSAGALSSSTGSSKLSGKVLDEFLKVRTVHTNRYTETCCYITIVYR